MNLTPTDVAELPLAAAVLDRENTVVARTPEWIASGPGAVSYPLDAGFHSAAHGRAQPINRLVVASPEGGDADCETIALALLAAMDDVATGLQGDPRRRVEMLAASLRLLLGRDPRGEGTTTGSTEQVIAYLRAALASRTSLTLHVAAAPHAMYVAPEVIAEVLVQLAANAERHEGATAVTLTAEPQRFLLSWAPQGEVPQRRFETSRQSANRRRWGLGFARTAADCVGGVIYPPAVDALGTATAVFEFGSHHLGLPLACARGSRIVKANRAWSEETGLAVGEDSGRRPRLRELVALAETKPGSIVSLGGWLARRSGDHTWFAIPPDGTVARAREMLSGLTHERALWEGIPEADSGRIFALSSLLATRFGAAFPQVPGSSWNRVMPDAARVAGVRFPVPRFAGLAALEPRIVAYLAAEYGAGFDAEGEDLFLRIAAEHRNDPLMRIFLEPGDDALRLSA